jgi:multidrug efflux pump subunit AcrA (membrane-fusion protein)
MIRLLILLLPLALFAEQIKIEHAKIRKVGKIVHTNAKIIQLSTQKQLVVSRLPGHIEHYFVTAGDRVEKGDKIARIESIALSDMTAKYLALKQQANAARSALQTARTLYKKGLGSQNALNSKIVALEEILAKRNALASQLRSLGIDARRLKQPTDRLVLKAHAKGEIGEILAPLHSNVDAQTPIVSIVQEGGYYALAYMNIEDAIKVDGASKAVVKIAQRLYPAHFIQLYPQVDEETQRAKLLFMLKEHRGKILLGAYVPIDIEISPYKEAVTIRQSALTLLNGDWVIFIPKKTEVSKRHDEDEKHESEEHVEEEHQEEEHEHHHEAEIPYEPRVVEVVARVGNIAVVKGIKAKEEYVSDGVYFVKSMILKSSLGEHGH